MLYENTAIKLLPLISKYNRHNIGEPKKNESTTQGIIATFYNNLREFVKTGFLLSLVIATLTACGNDNSVAPENPIFPIPDPSLTIVVQGNGVVSSTPEGIDCGTDCSQVFSKDSIVSLTATPNTGSEFTAWSGHDDCSDGSVTLTNSINCTATFQLTVIPTNTLTIQVNPGPGTGRVTSSPTGIDCGTTCSSVFDQGTMVTLTAIANANSQFVSWNGANDCSDGLVTMSTDINCTASFKLRATFTLSIIANSGSGTGSGNVTSSPSGIDCGEICSHQFPEGGVIELVATAKTGSYFVGWSGDNPDCLDGSVTLNADSNCNPIFDRTPVLSVTTNSGTGSGVVTSMPTGIDCGTDCSQQFPVGTLVNLSVVADAGSEFSSWSGNADCSDGSVSINTDLSCIAQFNDLLLRTSTNIEFKSDAGARMTQGDPVLLTGTLFPITVVKGDIEIQVVNPDGSIAVIDNIQTDASGIFSSTYTAAAFGEIYVSATFAGDGDHKPSAASLIVPTIEHNGIAIIVRAGPTGGGYRARTMIADQAYTAFLNTGMAAADIFYMYPGAPGSMGACSLEPSVANLTCAIEKWAATRINTNSRNGPLKTPLNVVIISAGSPTLANIYGATDVVSPVEIDAMFDNLYTTIAATMTATGITPPNFIPINFIIESDYSGIFSIPVGGQAGRTTSTSTDSRTFSSSLLNGQISFGYSFFETISNGGSLGAAFAAGDAATYLYLSTQLPELNADYDQSVNEIADKFAADGLKLESQYSATNAPRIRAVTSSQTIDRVSATAYLWADVTDVDGDPITAHSTITPPAGSGLSTQVVILTDDNGNGRFDATQSGFTVPGIYKLLYTASDSNRKMAKIRSGTVTVSP